MQQEQQISLARGAAGMEPGFAKSGLGALEGKFKLFNRCW
jgi:hypothetical protein